MGSITGGVLRLANTASATANNLTSLSTFTVNTGGALTPSFGGATVVNAVGTANIIMAGSALNWVGDLIPKGSQGQYYSITPQNVNNAVPDITSLQNLNSLLSSATPATLGAPNAGLTAAVSDVNFASVNTPAYQSVGFSQTDNLMARWTGKLSISPAEAARHVSLQRRPLPRD